MRPRQLIFSVLIGLGWAAAPPLTPTPLPGGERGSVFSPLPAGERGRGEGPAELPAHYFKLMEAELQAADAAKSNPGAMFAAAVLYAKKHPANPSHGDKKKLELALKLGDLLAGETENDKAENKQDYEWEIH